MDGDLGRRIAINQAGKNTTGGFYGRTLSGFRDVISGPFSSEIIAQAHGRQDGNWKSIEWRRELPDSEAPSGRRFSARTSPYGLRISDDCQRLEVEADRKPGTHA